MNKEIHRLVQTIHDRPGRTVLVTAGAGTYALAWLLGVAGASRTLLEALVPYDWAAFDDFLGQTPGQYVASSTARLMAGRALTRGRWLHQDEHIVGLSCTATIVTDRPKRGEHRAHIAAWQPSCVVEYSLYLEKGARDRAGEEELVSRLMLNALARAFDLEIELELPLGQGDHCEIVSFDVANMAHQLHEEHIPYFLLQEDGQLVEEITPPMLILSGAFNPLHNGHLDLARVAQARLKKPIAFELAVRNVDKPPLATQEVLDRMAQFAGRWPILASNAPTFVEKARLYPGATFVVGYDTAERIIQPRYYDDSEAKMEAALAEIRERGCDFLVAGRTDEDDVFHKASDLRIPADFKALFEPLPDFRRDISSTDLRASGSRGSR